MLKVGIKKVEGFEDIPLPEYKTTGSSGMDLHAAIGQPILLMYGKSVLVSAGFCMSLPAGYEAQIRPRSGLALKYGISLVNSPGTIDEDYRGEVGVIVINHGDEPFGINRGDRIAQMIIQPTTKIKWVEGDLDKTDRGVGGFGSTGHN